MFRSPPLSHPKIPLLEDFFQALHDEFQLPNSPRRPLAMGIISNSLAPGQLFLQGATVTYRVLV